MSRRRTRILVAVVVAAALVGTVAVARADRHPRPDAADTPAASAPAPVRVVLPGRPGQSAQVTDSRLVKAPDGSTYNGLDVAFVRMMIAHHAQALRIAGLAPQRSRDGLVRALAQRITAAQGPEIEVMRAWLGQRGLGEADPTHDHAAMPGMQNEADLAALAAAQGRDFDRRFVAMMSAHHRGAVEMAGGVLAGGTDQSVSELANELAVEQTAEIRRMDQFGLG